jgi:hypothetical protein
MKTILDLKWKRGRSLCLCFCTSLLLCGAAAACGGSSNSATSDQQAIRSTLTSMRVALGNSDWARACQYYSQRDREQLVANAQKLGLGASTCADALKAEHAAIHATAAAERAALKAMQATLRYESITVHDNTATVKFSFTYNGQTLKETDSLICENGVWKDNPPLTLP